VSRSLARTDQVLSAALCALGFLGLRLAGDLFMTGGPERVLLAAVAVRIGFSGNILLRGALALFERIWIAHGLVFLDGWRGLEWVRPAPQIAMRSCAAHPSGRRECRASGADRQMLHPPIPAGSPSGRARVVSACRRYRRRRRSICANRPPACDATPAASMASGGNRSSSEPGAAAFV